MEKTQGGKAAKGSTNVTEPLYPAPSPEHHPRNVASEVSTGTSPSDLTPVVKQGQTGVRASSLCRLPYASTGLFQSTKLALLNPRKSLPRKTGPRGSQS